MEDRSSIILPSPRQETIYASGFIRAALMDNLGTVANV